MPLPPKEIPALFLSSFVACFSVGDSCIISVSPSIVGFDATDEFQHLQEKFCLFSMQKSGSEKQTPNFKCSTSQLVSHSPRSSAFHCSLEAHGYDVYLATSCFAIRLKAFHLDELLWSLLRHISIAIVTTNERVWKHAKQNLLSGTC